MRIDEIREENGLARDAEHLEHFAHPGWRVGGVVRVGRRGRIGRGGGNG